jgi:hypothetical protein
MRVKAQTLYRAGGPVVGTHAELSSLLYYGGGGGGGEPAMDRSKAAA